MLPLEGNMIIKHIVISICADCLDGKGQECHTPGCAFFLHKVDLPIDPGLYVVMNEYDDDTLQPADASDGLTPCSCKAPWFGSYHFCSNCGGHKLARS